MMMPDFQSDAWLSLPADQRKEIALLVHAFASAPAQGVGPWMEAKAAELGMPYRAFQAKFYTFCASLCDWTSLIDRRRTPRPRPSNIIPFRLPA